MKYLPDHFKSNKFGTTKAEETDKNAKIDYKIVTLEHEDISLLNSIKPDTWSSISEIHNHYLTVKSAYPIKAVGSDGEILGIGTGLLFNKTGWLAHIIVSGLYQNRGIGTAVVNNRVEFLRERCGCKTITLTATDQGYPVYKKIGFKEESMYRIMIKPENVVFPERHTSNIYEIEEKYYDEIFALDFKTSGEQRNEFLRPLLAKGFMYVKNNHVQGFYIPQFGDSGVTALTEEAGIALLQERIFEDAKIFIPAENEAGYKYLLSEGYKELKQIHRMILGCPFPRNPEYCYSRIGGFTG